MIDERATNWTGRPVPAPRLGQARVPRSRGGRGLRAAVGASSGTCSVSTSLTRPQRGTPVWKRCSASARALNGRRLDALELRGPGTELTIGLLADLLLAGGRLRDPHRRPSPPEHPHRGGLHDARPAPVGRPRHLDQAARAQRRHDHPRSPRALRGRTAPSRSRPTRTAGRCARRSRSTRAPARLGEVALVDREGRIGPLGTVFYDTLLDENAASHIALGSGFQFAVEEEDRGAHQQERDPHRLHDRLARARGHGRHRRGRAYPRAARRRLADLSLALSGTGPMIEPLWRRRSIWARTISPRAARSSRT